MRRIRLLASCLADPSGIKFRGHEVEMPDDQAAVMVATGQWEYVAAPAEANPETPAKAAVLTEIAQGIPGCTPRRREFRKRETP